MKTVEAAVHLFPPADEECFIDANILHAHEENLGDISIFATEILREVTEGNRLAATNASAMTDAIHKIMLSEAAMKFKRERAGLVSWLQRHQDRIKELTLFKQAAEEFSLIPFRLLAIDTGVLRAAGEVAVRYGLLTNDAIIVAQMQAHQIRHLVSNDRDFSRVQDIRVWLPS